MSSRKCCLCSKIIESETADILTMGGYGIPRYLCEECANDLNTVTRGTTSDGIHAAMDRLGKKMSVSDVEDKLVAAPEGMLYTPEEIERRIHFQEQYYDSHVEMTK